MEETERTFWPTQYKCLNKNFNFKKTAPEDDTGYDLKVPCGRFSYNFMP